MKIPENSKPAFVPCAAGNNAQADCCITRRGDLVRLIGHGTMDFTPDAAISTAMLVAMVAVECGYRNGDELARIAEFWRALAVQCGWDDPMMDDGK